MKKLIVLAIAMLLVSMGAFAQVTISGEVEYQAGTDFADGFADTTWVEVNVTAAVNDYDTVHIDLEVDGVNEALPGIFLGTYNTSGARDEGILEEAWFVQDLGGRFMLPETVGLMVYYGFEEFESAGVGQVTKSEMEFGVLDWNPQGWGTKVSLGIMDMVTVDVVWLYSDAFGSGMGYSNNAYNMLFDVHGAYGPVEFQVAYADEQVDSDGELAFGAGKIGLAAGYTDEVADGITVDVGGKFAYDIDAADLPASKDNRGDFQYAVAAGVDYQSMVGFNIAFRGFDGAEAEAVGLELWAMPIELVYIQLMAHIGLDDAIWQETFDSFEGAIEFNVGDVDWYLGYLFVAEDDATAGATGIDKGKAELFPSALKDATVTGQFFFGAEIAY